VHALFEEYDHDGSGYIELSELRGFLDAMSTDRRNTTSNQVMGAHSPTRRKQKTTGTVLSGSGLQEEEEQYEVGSPPPSPPASTTGPCCRGVQIRTATGAVPGPYPSPVRGAGQGSPQRARVATASALPPQAPATGTASVRLSDAATRVGDVKSQPKMSMAAAASAVSFATTVNAAASKTAHRRKRHLSLETSQVTDEVRKEMIKGSQELLDKTNLWRFKTYYIFPLIEKLRFLDLGSRVVFPVAYIIFILVTMSRVNFGYDHYALLRPTDVSALATSISECYCKQTADDYCASRGL
jgi:hypothetical protein